MNVDSDEAVRRQVLAEGLRVEADEGQRNAVRKIVSRSFDEREMRLIRGAVIRVEQPEIEGVAGEYIEKDGDYLVRIAPGALDVNEPDTLVHELVHHLRHVDASRPDRHRTDHNMDDLDLDEDETRTEAEAITRWRPHTDTPENVGYWGEHDEAVAEESARELRNADHGAPALHPSRHDRRERHRHDCERQHGDHRHQSVPPVQEAKHLIEAQLTS